MSFNINLPPIAPGTVAPPDSTRPAGDMASATRRLAAVAEMPPHHAAILSPYLDQGFKELYRDALAAGKHEVLEALLSNGLANPNKFRWRYSPLTMCALGGHLKCVDLLVKHGADFDLQDSRGTALCHACDEAEDDDLKIWHVVAYLMARGASLDIDDRRGNSPRTMLRPEALMRLFEAAFKKNDKEAMSTFVTIVARLVPDDKAAWTLAKMAIALDGHPPELVVRIDAALDKYLDAVPEDHPVPVEVAPYVPLHNVKESFLSLCPDSWAKSSGHVPYDSVLHGLDAIHLAATMLLDPHGPVPHAMVILSFVLRQAFAQETLLSHREALLAAATRLQEDLRKSPFKAVVARVPILEEALLAVTHPL